MGLRAFQYTGALPRLFCGPDSLAQLGRELDRLKSRRAVLVCGTSLARAGSPLELVKSALGDRCAGVYPGVQAHSPLPAVVAAAEALRQLDADAVVAVGGGSAVVTARAAAILLAEGMDARALCTLQDERGELRSPKLAAPKLPQIVIPTTPNTATVKTGSAVFDPATGERLALFDPKTRAQSVFIHPKLLETAPRELLVSASLDTFTLALEGLCSLAGNPISDAMLMHAVRLLATHLSSPGADADPTSRSELVLAAVLSGHGTDATGAGIATAIGHAIGSSYGVENGLVKAAVMPHTLRFNAEAAPEGIAKILASLELQPSAGSAAVVQVNNTLGPLFVALSPARLRDLGVPREALTTIAWQVMRDWFLRGNPRPVHTPADVLPLLEAAW